VGVVQKQHAAQDFVLKKIRENVPVTIYHGVKSLRTLHRAIGRLDQ
jgi:hypothetical protein